MDLKSLVRSESGRKSTSKGALLKFIRDIVSDPPSGCAIWPYGKDGSGYGQLRHGGGKIGAHRLAWEFFHGRKMGEGAHAAHAPDICHNRLCVNPLHVREASPSENCADRVIDGTTNRGERQGQSKLTEAQVLAIRADNRRLKDIAADFGVCLVTISDIRHRRTWAWL